MGFNAYPIFSPDSLFHLNKNTGNLPIAEYEGSPRRFGNYQQELPHHQYAYTAQAKAQPNTDRPPSSRKMLTSPTLFPPRPGFPKVCLVTSS